METQSLWPDFAIETIKKPKTILKEQAGYLMAKTNNVLSADVETTIFQEDVLHTFYVVAPAMNNYRYEIFSVRHGVTHYYPLVIGNKLLWNSSKEAKNEEEFIDLLRQTFNDPKIVKIISSLLSQSLAE